MFKTITIDEINSNSVSLETILSEIAEYVLNGEGLTTRKAELMKIGETEISLGQAITSLYFMRILQSANIPVSEDLLFLDTEAKKLSKYIDKISEVAKAYPDQLSLDDLRNEISRSLVELSDLTTQVNLIKGITINLTGLIDLANRNPRFKELLNFKIPDNLDLNDIETTVTENVAEFMNILKAEDTIYKPLILGGAVNLRQLGQTFVNIGLKPDIEGNVIPNPINTSFARGLRSREDYMTCAIGARKALIINFKQVRTSGYMARKLLLLSGERNLDSACECCDSKHGLKFKMDSYEFFRRFAGRYLLDGTYLNGTEAEYEELYKDREVEVRSPITCNGANGICLKCYGELSKLNKDYNVGIIAVLLLTEKLTQMLLSSKHLLMAKTEKIQWSEEFLSAFNVDRNEVYPNIESSKATISVQDLYEDDDGDLYTNRVQVKSGNKKILVDSPKKLFLNRDDAKKFETESKEITIHLDANSACFFMKTKNIELNSTLSTLINLLQKSDHAGFGDDITAITREFLTKLIESGFNLMAIHSELILSCLVKEAGSNSRPDFSADTLPPITVDYVSNAIKNSEAVSNSLAFEKIKQQLYEVSTYAKSKSGIFDPLFV